MDTRFPARVPPPPKFLSPEEDIQKAAHVLRNSKRPLIIIGADCNDESCVRPLLNLVEGCGIPFLATPLGKGVLPDDHPLCIAPARSLALKESDTILLCGARLNWMLHFGLPPRFAKDVKIVQIDGTPEQLHQNIPATVGLCGDCGHTLEAVKNALNPWKYPFNSEWLKKLSAKVQANSDTVKNMTIDCTLPLNYFAAYKPIRDSVPRDVIIVNEGANTMDIGRTILPNFKPKHRLDAGTFGTMGVGLGYAIAAAVYCRDHSPNTKVLCVQGDSAFGFSGMEYETIARYKLAITIVVFNNNGIYGGMDKSSWDELPRDSHPTLLSLLPPTCLSPNASYEKMTECFGGKGTLCTTSRQIKDSVTNAFKSNQASIINILINPTADRKPQEHNWLTRSKM